MSKTWETKKQILNILREKNRTLTDISTRLNLAPSTVSQHLKELLGMGAIQETEQRFSRKWKYYEVNREFYDRMVEEQPLIATQRRKYLIPSAGILVIVIAAIVSFVYLGSSAVNLANAGSVGQSGYTLMSVSDAPMLYNITGLFITVSSVSVHSETTGKWYTSSLSNETFNLVSLDNVSQVMSNVKLPPGTYNKIILNIKNVSATINGTNQNVIVPTSRLYILTNFNVTNSTTNWLNFDFDLGKSIHITANGRIVMLPVINLRYANGAQVGSDSTGRIIVNSYGNISLTQICGMNNNGTMNTNYTIPQNVNIQIGQNNKITIMPTQNVPFIVRGRTAIIIATNASQIANVSPEELHYIINSTILSNSTVPINANCVAGRFGIICSANSNETLNASEVSKYINAVRIGIGVVIRGGANQSASGCPPICVAPCSNCIIPTNSSIAPWQNVTIENNSSINSTLTSNQGLYACNISSDCIVVATTACQNGLQYQSTCINSTYESAYLSTRAAILHNESTVCPLFMVASNTSCGCTDSRCVLIYKPGT